MSKRQPLEEVSFDIRAATREQAAEILGISVRRLHELVAADILPAPVRHGVYDLPPLVNAYGVHRMGVAIPQTFDDAYRPYLRARAVLREYLRRHPEHET